MRDPTDLQLGICFWKPKMKTEMNWYTDFSHICWKRITVSNISIRERSVNSNYVPQKAEHFRHRTEFFCQYVMVNPFREGERNIRHTRGCELGEGMCQYGAHWGFGYLMSFVLVSFQLLHTQMDLLDLRAWGRQESLLYIITQCPWPIRLSE